MGLVVNNVPFDRAIMMTDNERMAWLILIGQANGKRWDWGMMNWLPDRDD